MDAASEHTAPAVPDDRPSTESPTCEKKAIRLRASRRPSTRSFHGRSSDTIVVHPPEQQRHQRCSAFKPEALRSRGPHSGSSRVRTSSMTRHSSSTMDSPARTATGRPKRALKGVANAHPCACGKSYSRAEHLRRHRQNHTENLSCDHPGCEKRIFHRLDLLQRHKASHNSNLVRKRVSLATVNLTPRRERRGNDSSLTEGLNIKIPSPPSLTALGPAAVLAGPESIGYPDEEFLGPLEICGLNSLKPPPSVSLPRYLIHRDIEGTQLQPLQAGSVPFENRFNLYLPYDSSSSGRASPHFPYDGAYLSQAFDPSAFRPRNGSNASSEFWHPNYRSSSISPISVSPQTQNIFLTYNNPFLTIGPSEPTQALYSMADDLPFSLRHRDHTPVHGSGETPFLSVDQQLLHGIDVSTQDYYIEQYWQQFHPLFPVIHRPTFLLNETPTLVSTAMMAIGAHFVDTTMSQQDAKFFYDSYLKQLAALSSFAALDVSTMQAIFLVEALTLYKTRRASQGLSDPFLRMYEHLASTPSIREREAVDELADITPTTNERRVFQQWTRWTDVHVKQRLLLSSFVLEAQQAVLLARDSVSSITSEIDLPLPAVGDLWEAENARVWANMILQNVSQTVYAHEIIENPSTILPNTLDTFQSAVVIATYDNLFLTSTTLSSANPFLSPIGKLTQTPAFQSVLANDSATQTYFQVSELIHNAPRRALLAVSGESWIYGSRLSANAAEAKAEFAALKLELRNWADDTDMPGQHPEQPFESAEQPRQRALRSALRIVSLAVNRSSPPWEPGLFGGEIAVYLSTLVLWSLCSRALQRTLPFDFGVSLDHLQNSNSAEISAHMSQTSIVDFLRRAEADVAAGKDIKNCREGVRDVILSTKKMFRGNEGVEKHLGELSLGCTAVLEKLWTKGWEEPWFRDEFDAEFPCDFDQISSF